MTQITKLSISNYLSIREFETTKLGKLNLIKGGNRKGKTAILKAITDGFTGGGLRTNLIRTGEDKAEILIELDSGLSVRRRFTQSGSSLNVVDGDGAVSKPQEVLNKILGRFSFDPTKFFLADPVEQRSLLLSAIDVKVSKEFLASYTKHMEYNFDSYDFNQHGLTLLDEIKDSVYRQRSTRAAVIKELTNDTKQIEQILPDDFDREESAAVDRIAITTELEAATTAIVHFEADLADRDRIKKDADRYEDAIQELEGDADGYKGKLLAMQKRHTAEVAMLAADKKQVESRLANGLKKQKEIEGELTSVEDKLDAFEAPDVDSIKQALNSCALHERYVREHDKLLELQTELQKVSEDKAHLDKFYDQLRKEIPRELLKTADLPVEGLTICGDRIAVNNISLDTFSTSEEITFACKIARALIPKDGIRVILVDGYESLDEDAREAFEEEALADDCEYFMTRVTRGDLAIESKG